MFFELFEILDLFKRPMFLYIGEKKHHSTISGILFSLAIYGFLMHSFFISDMFSKKNPLVYDQGIITQSRPELRFNTPIMLYVSDSAGGKYFDPTIFTVKAINYDMIADPGTNNGKIARMIDTKVLKLCEPSDFGDPEDYYRQGFKNYFCMKQKNVTVGGYWDESQVKYLHTYIERCKNTTSDLICKSDEEIDEFFSRKFYGIHMPNTFLDMKDYDLPIKSIWRTEYQLIDVNMMKRLKVFVKKIEFNDDKGYIFEESVLQNSFTYDYTEIDFKNQNRSPIMFEIFLYSSAVIQKKVRKYQKASEVLAALGGQASFLMIFGVLFTELQYFLGLTSTVINNLYRFQQQAKSSKGSKQRDSVDIDDSAASKSADLSRNFEAPKNALIKQSSKFKSKTTNKNSQSGLPVSERRGMLENEENLSTAKEPPSTSKGYIQRKIVETVSCDLEPMTIELMEPPKQLWAQDSNMSLSPTGKKKVQFLSRLGQLEESQQQISFGIKDFIKMSVLRFFRRKLGFKEKLFVKAKDRFLKEIDVLNILRRLQELEKLKIILLSPEQLDLFSLLQKPMIYIEEAKEDFHSALFSESQTPSFNQRMSVLVGSIDRKEGVNDKNEKLAHERALKYYRNLKAGSAPSDIDARLLNYVEERMREAENNF